MENKNVARIRNTFVLLVQSGLTKKQIPKLPFDKKTSFVHQKIFIGHRFLASSKLTIQNISTLFISYSEINIDDN